MNGFVGVRAVVYAVPPGGEAAAWYVQLFGNKVPKPFFGDAGFAVGSAEVDLDSHAAVRTLAVGKSRTSTRLSRLLSLERDAGLGIQSSATPAWRSRDLFREPPRLMESTPAQQ
jgi:hypothetical protein